MLEVTSTSAEAQLGVDFAQIYKNSDLYEWVEIQLLLIVVLTKYELVLSQNTNAECSLLIICLISSDMFLERAWEREFIKRLENFTYFKLADDEK